MADNDVEKQPIFRTKILRNRTRNCIPLKGFCSRICGQMCRRNVPWLCLLVFLLGEVIGLVLFTCWAVDCFFREFRTTPICTHFVLFPSPEIFKSVWLFMCVCTSLFLIYHICRRSPAFPGARVVARHLKIKIYFWKILFVLLVVCMYDLVIMIDQPRTVKTASCILFMLEKVLAVTVMFLVNFLPQFWNSEDVKLKWWLYKMALLLYSVRYYCLALLGSTIAAYKVLTVPQPQTDHRPSVEAVIDIMLLITNNGFRYFVADVFLSKLFHEDLDILGSACASKKIDESIGVGETNGDSVVLRETPVHEFDE